MLLLATTPKPPYYAVIFSSVNKNVDNGAYQRTAKRMVELASQQPGFLGIEFAHEEIGITVSYWQDLASIKQWKANSEHFEAQKNGREIWYNSFKLRISKVEKDYGL